MNLVSTDATQCDLVSESSPLTAIRQLALTYTPPAPVLTCTRVLPWGACKGTKFRRFAGPTGMAYRCEKCKADTASCSCTHHYGAHGAHGCMGVLDSGDLCECQLRSK